jgi:cystathionine beta-lyase/cystathionine gamma-synthase
MDQKNEDVPMTAFVDPIERASLIVNRDDAQPYDAVVPPIVQSSLFTFPSFEELEATFRGEKVRPIYSRGLNPTVQQLEVKLAALEETDEAIGFASGMAAISSTVMSFVKPGDRMVCVRHIYPDCYRLFETLLKRWNIAVTYVDGADHAAVEAALPGATLLYMESPTSWMMQAHDVAALAALARKHHVLSVIDNSWASPVFQQPTRLGVDLVLHSASKYIGGHSDTVAGAVAGAAELIDEIRRATCPYLGGKLSPFEAWLLLRGLRTLPVRMRAHEAGALTIAGRLSEHPHVTAVHHPGLGKRLPHGLQGTSGLFSFAFDDGVDIRTFCNRLRIFKMGVSWGGHESLAMPALIARLQATGPNSAIDFGVPERVVRLHIGLEGPDALWGDLDAAIGSSLNRGST